MARVKSGAGAPRSQKDRKQVLGADKRNFHPVIPAKAGIQEF
jgi:hypothetical protein